MKIGNIELDTPVALAPMAGISDLPYRVICREFGCGLTVSEMVSAKGLLYKNEKTFAMLQIDEAERPTAIQLFGSVPEELAEAARIVEAQGADIIDSELWKRRGQISSTLTWDALCPRWSITEKGPL